MDRVNRGLFVMPAVLVATMLGAGQHARGTAPVVRYASPTGVASATCKQAAPCDLLTAVNSAPSDAEVVVESGTYDKATPLATPLSDNHGPLNIHGPAHGARPVIYSAASPGLYLGSSDVSNLAVIGGSSGGTVLLDYNGTVSHVMVTATDVSGTACAVYHVLEDSLCVATGDGGEAISLYSATGGPARAVVAATLRGDTGIATASFGVGLDVTASGPATVTGTATNDIFQGVDDDVYIQTTGSAAVASATLRHSDYATRHISAGGGAPDGSASIDSDNTNTTVAPAFVNAATGNYRELASSPTVDTGAKDAASETDLGAAPRTAGGAPDMGAYEVLTAPRLHALKVIKTTPHRARLTLKADAMGLPTTLTVRLSQHGHHATRTVSAGRAAAVVSRHVVLRGLKPATTYTVTIVAHSAGGKSARLHHKVRTKKA